MDNYRFVKANKNDCDLLYKWTNDKEVRNNSFNTNRVTYEEHVKWFMNKLDDKNTLIYIFKNKQEPIGVMRLERIDEKSLLINFSIASNYRGRGCASQLLELIKIQFGDYTLVGEVKKDNIGSIKAFQRAGYFIKEKLNHLVFYSKNE